MGRLPVVAVAANLVQGRARQHAYRNFCVRRGWTVVTALANARAASVGLLWERTSRHGQLRGGVGRPKSGAVAEADRPLVQQGRFGRLLKFPPGFPPLHDGEL